MTDRDLTPADRQRYARQLQLPQVGAEGQAKLKAARVLIVGAGGLGSPAALYLPAEQAEFVLAEGQEGRAIGLYCQSGRRFGRLARRLRSLGIKSVYSLENGLESKPAD